MLVAERSKTSIGVNIREAGRDGAAEGVGSRSVSVTVIAGGVDYDGKPIALG